jgi:hypothetical protein
MKIVDEEQSTEKEEIQKDTEEFVKEEVLEEAKELSREELLKKLGIKEPDDTWIETILEDMFRPSEEELNELKEKLENEIVNRIKMMEGVDDVKTNLKVKWENGRYYLFGDVNVKRKRILGIIKKDIDPSIVKFEIDKIIRKLLSRYTSGISINVE